MDKFSVIIVCAGTAQRMNGIDKQLFKLNSLPVFLHSVYTFSKIERVDDIIIVAGSHNKKEFDKELLKHTFEKNIKITTGGKTRQESVLNGVNLCSDKSNYIAIHDGARPLINQNDIENAFDNAIKYNATTLAVKVKDTIKQVNNDNFIDYTPNRDLLYQIQTPQVFLKELYLNSVLKAKKAKKDFTDDCQLIEYSNKKVYITNGSYENIKITTAEDIIIANSILMSKGEK